MVSVIALAKLAAKLHFVNLFEDCLGILTQVFMKEAVAAIGILALAVSLWFVKGYSDEKIIDSKNETRP